MRNAFNMRHALAKKTVELSKLPWLSDRKAEKCIQRMVAITRQQLVEIGSVYWRHLGVLYVYRKPESRRPHPKTGVPWIYGEHNTLRLELELRFKNLDGYRKYKNWPIEKRKYKSARIERAEGAGEDKLRAMLVEELSEPPFANGYGDAVRRRAGWRYFDYVGGQAVVNGESVIAFQHAFADAVVHFVRTGRVVGFRGLGTVKKCARPGTAKLFPRVEPAIVPSREFRREMNGGNPPNRPQPGWEWVLGL